MKTKKHLCDVCGMSVDSIGFLHRLKKTTPQSWNGSIFLETCINCSDFLDECRATFVQDLRMAFAKNQKAQKLKVMKKNVRTPVVQKRRMQVQKALQTFSR